MTLYQVPNDGYTSGTDMLIHGYTMSPNVPLNASGTTTLSVTVLANVVIQFAKATITNSIVIDFNGALGLYFLDFSQVIFPFPVVVLHNTPSITFTISTLVPTAAGQKSLIPVFCGVNTPMLSVG